ncbi:MAG: hypothetical protein LBR11_12150 [Deltaproteobacteria bacterium]|jgi:hypothetical protein|nr:hypothetical protein [Deltaproteobacteria bacterium]
MSDDTIPIKIVVLISAKIVTFSDPIEIGLISVMIVTFSDPIEIDLISVMIVTFSDPIEIDRISAKIVTFSDPMGIGLIKVIIGRIDLGKAIIALALATSIVLVGLVETMLVGRSGLVGLVETM